MMGLRTVWALGMSNVRPDPNVPLRAKLFQSVNADKQIAAIEAELIRARAARLNEQPACFIAGTLIHTREGLRPIEEIKVGDWVLSKPEEGAGERSYKRVTRTFVHESNNIWLMQVNYRITDPAEFHRAAGHTEMDGEKVYLGTETLVVTAEHPFFTKEKGWVAAANLGWGTHVEMANGDFTLTSAYIVQIYQSETANLGWAPIERPSKDTGGDIVEFGAAGLNLVHHTLPQKTKYDEQGFVAPLVRTVYNFEVEDNHTYYVGQVGLWVHNTKFVPVYIVVENEARLLNGTQPGRSLILKANHGVSSNIPTLSARHVHLYLAAVDGVIVAPGTNRRPAACMRTGTSAIRKY